MELTDKQNIELLRIFSPRPLQSIGDDKAFFVNIDEIQKIHLAVETNENALIIGERGSGKTSLLNHIKYEYTNSKKDKQSIVPIQLNLLRIENFNQTTFLETLVDGVFDSVMKLRTTSKKIMDVLEISFTGSSSNENMRSLPMTSKENTTYSRKKANYETFVERLERLVHTLQDRNIKIFVIIDDGDKINSKLIWDVFRGLRDILWDLRVPLIMSVLPEQVSEITKPPLDQFFQYRIKMKPYDEIKASKLIARRVGFTKQKMELENEVPERLIANTKGNPRSIISIMKRVLESTKETSKITKMMIEEVESPYSSELSSIERSVINYLVHNPYMSASVEDFSKKLGVTRSRLAQILNELRERGLIKSTKDGRREKYYVANKGLQDRVKADKKKKKKKNRRP